jgi:hypothetical protein
MHGLSTRYFFVIKIGVTIGLVVAFNAMFAEDFAGVWIGVFALLWAGLVMLVRPATRHSRTGAIALGAAALFGVTLLYDPGRLNWAMFWAALSIAAIAPRTNRFDDAGRWAMRLVLHALSGAASPIADLVRLQHCRSRTKGVTVRGLAALLALPLAGTAIFTILFAQANPLIADMIGRIEFPSIWKLAEWTFVTICVWSMLRPRKLVTALVAKLPPMDIGLPGPSLHSVLIALTLFNALFALENGLDIAFLWSGAPLPTGMSMTEYVHRGAYPLIVTALLAGLFVLTMLRAGSATAANPLARRLVALWVAQNVFLVASSALRTINYIDLYMLTAWRIAALAWMGLVAIGLVLICWRMWVGKSARWLINANALVALLVLVPCCVIDLDAIAATWNVRHAREVGGRAAPIDLCYLDQRGAAALLPLIEMEGRPLPPALLDQLHFLRANQFEALEQAQADWQHWTPHGAWRLARAKASLPAHPAAPRALARNEYRTCNGIKVSTLTSSDLTEAPAQ